AAIQGRPELASALFSPTQLAEWEAMYDPADAARKLGRDGGTDVAMFGYYILNNVSIAFRTFAAGALAAVGSIVVLVTNGLVIGGVAGHLQAVGHGDPFWRFVCGHSSFELTAIVIAGGAGLQIGLRLLAPGRQRRIDALVEGGRRGALLCAGVLLMLVAAAFIEAFWSSIGWMPASVKFPVAALLWLLVGAWLWRGGRGRLPDDGDPA
ncbi:MAG TPA: stage II sporulation protein M, partial [Lysobacter sp.]|nr:stage II sporulation protein M [Lysobacter sp.]